MKGSTRIPGRIEWQHILARMVRYVETKDTNGYLGGGVQLSKDSHACQPMAVGFVLDTQSRAYSSR